MQKNSKRLTCSELDFDAIKDSLKQFLSTKDQFTDYNFEGSNLSMLLDVLAYNTHYRGLYDNFMLNEMFLDSASKRANVVSRAKEIGYTPTSVKAPIAYITFKLTNTTNGPDVFVLPKLSSFVATINSTQYSFITTESYSAVKTNGEYTIENVKLTQGDYITNRFSVTNGAKFVIPDKNVDSSTITVKIQDHAQSSVYTTFTYTDSLVNISSADRVFWLKEVNDGQYELEFGNNVIGKALEIGNVVHVEYIVTSGPLTNGARLFVYSGPSLYSGTPIVTTTAQSSGGASIESIESIKFNAPRLYSAQNRAVTVEDYRNLIYNLVPEAASVNVWSGSDNVPPEYGKVFICIKPRTLEKFTTIEKQSIKDSVIQSKNVVGIIPEIVDPTYIKVALDVAVYFNPRSTTKSQGDLELLVRNVISGYNNSELQKFDSILRFSKLVRLIDQADPAVVSNVTNIMIHRPVDPKYNLAANYAINLVNPIHTESQGSISTTGFYVDGTNTIHYLDDDGAGNMRLYYILNNVKQVVNPRIGTVDYSKGVISVVGLRITSIVGTEWKFIIKPSSYDVVSILNQLVVIPNDLVNVNVIVDQSFGGSQGGINYQFTSSRS